MHTNKCNRTKFQVVKLSVSEVPSCDSQSPSYIYHHQSISIALYFGYSECKYNFAA